AGSSASVARILGLPVVLVVNARSITRSAAALVKGFQSFDPEIAIAGVILNNVSGESHAEKACSAIEHYCGVPVLGTVPRLPELSLGMRHLGLVPFRECGDTREFRERIGRITEEIGRSVDLAAVVSAARDITPPPADTSCFSPAADRDVRIGVAYDHVFNFYYADLFDVLAAMGAEVRFFSPAGGILPDADGYIIGGGYPELHAAALSGNDAVRESLRHAAREGVPIYAECGGLMYLTRELVIAKGWEGHGEETRYPLCGVFPGKTLMPSRRVVSYVEGESNGENPMGTARFRGHEFHYSEVILPEGTRYAYRLSRGRGIRDGLDGAVCGRTIGSYTHLHPVASRSMFRRFVAACRNGGDA
ncbi:MAG: cobyrinate a,c-diamide synthase, partial [Methanolinea sp.]